MKKQLIPTIALLLILCALGWYIDSVAHQEITVAARFVIYAAAISVLLVILIGVVYLILIFRERLLLERAGRKVSEREANVYYIVADEGQQVFIRDTDQKATWRNAHLDSRIYASGQEIQPSTIEVNAWQVYTLRNRPQMIERVGTPLLPAQTQIDLLGALDSVQRCLIVGASDVGKTTLLQWLVSRRGQVSKVIVIDPHAYPDKWQDCVVVGAGRNYPEIDRTLDALVRLMTKRYDEIGKGIVAEQGHSRITILIDEWRAIVYNVKKASEAIKALLTESRKAAFSVFVATHSDRAKPLGLDGEYDLKDGFAVVRLSIVNGQRQATLDMGNGEMLASLPGPFKASDQAKMESDEFIDLEAEPTPAEARILQLYEEGQSISAIAKAVFGSKGGHQNKRVKEVIDKYYNV